MGEPTTLAVHRCRFVDFTPSAITALAFTPLPLPLLKDKKIAPGKHPKFGTLVVGHANGNIDLCDWSGAEGQTQSSQAWVVRKTLPGPFSSKIDSLAVVIRHPEKFGPNDTPPCSDLRVFSSGGGSELLEWDVERGCIRRTISSQGGSIWSIAANPSSTLLALGCEDGTVRLLSLAHDTLTHHRRFDRVKCRILSIAWGPPLPRATKSPPNRIDSDESSDDDDEDDWSDAWLVTGGSDSSLRKWDFSTGRVVDRMGTDKIRGERTLVWTVGVLGDGTIVSGDSLGMVKFWDSRTCTQLHSFQGHGADVLCLTIGPEGTTVYTSGVDQKISQFSLVKTSHPDKAASSFARSSSRWVQTCTRRMHSHDVRALATWPPYTILPPSHKRIFPIDTAPILASGGLDMSVVVTPAALPSSTVVKINNPLLTSIDSTFENSYHRRLAYPCGSSSVLAVRIARQARLISCMGDTGLSVWRILERPPLSDDGDLVNRTQEAHDSKVWEKVLNMELKVHTNLIASAISDDGRWLVASDAYETKLFSIEVDPEGNLHPKRIRDFSSILQTSLRDFSISTGGLAFRFSPDSSKLVMSTAMSSHILIIDLSANDEKPHVLRRFEHHRLRTTIVRDRVVKGRKTDGDVKMADAAVDISGDDDADDNLTTPVLASITGIEISPDGQWLATSDDRCRTHIFNLDAVQHHCVLPSFRQPVQALSFDAVHPNVLILAFPDNTLQFYDVEARRFPAWSKDLCKNLPKRLTRAHDPIMGITFDPATAELSSTEMNTPSHYVLLWGSTWICKLRLDDAEVGGMSGTKRRRESLVLSAPPLPTQRLDEDVPREFKMITQYRPILLVDFIAAGELVVVERPLVDVLATLPPAYFKHKYGAS